MTAARARKPTLAAMAALRGQRSLIVAAALIVNINVNAKERERSRR
jgi:hypothetical protein